MLSTTDDTLVSAKMAQLLLLVVETVFGLDTVDGGREGVPCVTSCLFFSFFLYMCPAHATSRIRSRAELGRDVVYSAWDSD